MANYVERVDLHEADDGDGIIDVWTTENPHGDYIRVLGGGLEDRLEVGAIQWQHGRWWRVEAPDGSVWCETSAEDEAREAMRPGDKLFREQRAELIEWAIVDD